MASAACDNSQSGVWRFSNRDALLVTLAAMHGVILAVWPIAPLISVGLWWNSNTIAHNFIHRPFFRSAILNRVFSAALSVLLGIPQTLWRDRHLAHHAGVEWRLRISLRLSIETALVVCLWITLALRQPRFFLIVYLPGYLGGLALCALQGYWEHAAGGPVSHYGFTYNFLCFNDGYHAEHHADPSIHWTELPHGTEPGASVLEALERLVLRSGRLQRFVLQCHRKAFRVLLPQLGTTRHAVIVGGGLYPRTALILRELLPGARLTIIDVNPRNLETARALLGGNVEYRNELYAAGELCDCDLTVIPLSLNGDRAAIYRNPPSPAVVAHDWMWRRRGTGCVVSIALGKRLNLVLR
jgi:Fatty acid desaturase